ncbi:MAG: 16S rRNA pseudouridine(516) synthase [Ruminococcus sp.]|jgi:16S rRNA pseudouridine516 synthase|nr:16S rRNA pseudouridine(516) synthase [Ruminococcus sp.]
MRTDKFLADSLLISRSEARELIKRRLVSREGVIIKDFGCDIKYGECLLCEGVTLFCREFIYLIMNKPAGFVCENGVKDSVFELIPVGLRKKGLSTVGRLDKDTEGLLLISDDGDFIHKIISPKKHIEKEYFVRLRDKIEIKTDIKEKFTAGIITNDFIAKPAEIEFTENEHEVFLTITEGKFHQIKKMFLALDNEVIYLKRTKSGNLKLPEDLPSGQVRELTEAEKQAIFEHQDER